MDHEAVGRRHDPILVVELLTDCIADPQWNREKMLCDYCEGYTPTPRDTDTKAKERPRRPGTPDPTLGCSGCWYGDVDKLQNPVIVTRPSRRRREVQYLGETLRYDPQTKRTIVENVDWEKRGELGELTREDLQPFRKPGSLLRAYPKRPWGRREAPGRPWETPNEEGHWAWAAWCEKWFWVAEPKKARNA